MAKPNDLRKYIPNGASTDADLYLLHLVFTSPLSETMTLVLMTLELYWASALKRKKKKEKKNILVGRNSMTKKGVG